MQNPAIALLVVPALVLAGCGSSGEEPPEGPLDTSYERQLPPSVPQGDSAAAPAPVNTSITGGPDERVDAIVGHGIQSEEAEAGAQ